MIDTQMLHIVREAVREWINFGATIGIWRRIYHILVMNDSASTPADSVK